MKDRIREACLEGDIGKINALLEKGFPIDSDIDDKGTTLLHKAAIYEDEKLVRFLLDKGASPFVHDVYGYRPIDIPFSHSLTNICEALAIKSPAQDVVIEGIPEQVLEGVFGFYNIVEEQKRKTLFRIKGKQLTPGIVSWACDKGLKLLKMDSCEYLVFKNSDTGKNEWREKDTGDVVSLCEVTLEKQSDSKYIWMLNIWFDPYPSKIENYTVGHVMIKEYGIGSKIDAHCRDENGA